MLGLRWRSFPALIFLPALAYLVIDPRVSHARLAA